MHNSALAIAALGLGLFVAGATLQAQSPPRDIEEFFDRLGRDNANPEMTCRMSKRLSRDGDVVWMSMECRAIGRRGRYGR